MRFEPLTFFLGSLAFASTALLLMNVLLAPILTSFAKLRSRTVHVNESSISLSIIVPAYNEAATISTKIDTILAAIEQIKTPVEVIIGADGCTDETVMVVRTILEKIGSPNWRLIEFKNEGKCSTINRLVKAANGNIVVSTDADIPLPAESISLLIEAFRSDADIGCVSCVPCFDGLQIGKQRSYWDLENKIRDAESKLGKLIVVTGMLYAYRKELFEEIPAGVMADDLWVPLCVLLKGYQSIQLQELLVPYEPTDESIEVHRRKRVIIGGMDVVFRLWKPLSLSPPLFSLVLVHKVNRWMFPLWLLVLALTSIHIFPPLVFAYAIVVLLALAHFGWRQCSNLLLTALSPLLALFSILQSRDFSRWEHTRKL